MARARRRHGGGASHRERRARSTRASDTAGGGTARAGHLREPAAAVAARSGRPAASATGEHGALRRHCGGAQAAL